MSTGTGSSTNCAVAIASASVYCRSFTTTKIRFASTQRGPPLEHVVVHVSEVGQPMAAGMVQEWGERCSRTRILSPGASCGAMTVTACSAPGKPGRFDSYVAGSRGQAQDAAGSEEQREANRQAGRAPLPDPARPDPADEMEASRRAHARDDGEEEDPDP